MAASKEILNLVDTFERNIDSTDHQIDILFYDLYGLTDEEIKTVENQILKNGIAINFG